MLFCEDIHSEPKMVKVSMRLLDKITVYIKRQYTSGMNREHGKEGIPHNVHIYEKLSVRRLFSVLLGIYSFKCSKLDFSGFRTHAIDLPLT